MILVNIFPRVSTKCCICLDECYEHQGLNVAAAGVKKSVTSRQVCIAMCLAETDYICRGIDYVNTWENNVGGVVMCRFYRENMYSVPDKITNKNGHSHCIVGKILH